MRKVETEMLAAIQSGRDWRSGNTAVESGRVYLHSNCIAVIKADRLWLTLAGWNTSTTRSRINALLTLVPGDLRVYQQRGTCFFSAVDFEQQAVIVDRETGRYRLRSDTEMPEG